MANPLDTPAIQSLCSSFGVPSLPPHLLLALSSCAFFFFVQSFSHFISPILFPAQFSLLSKRTSIDWDLHSTGWIHALIATPISLYLINYPSPQIIKDPIFGYSPLEGSLLAVSAGYFLYDLIISVALVRTHGIPFVLHASACCYIFFKAYTPILIGFSGHFLVWELSTIFLHPHWYLDKLGFTGSKLQVVNGAFLLSSFFGARICWGIYQTFNLWIKLEDPRIGTPMRWGFRMANLALCGLNITWFRAMIVSVQKRLKSKPSVSDGSAVKKNKET